MRLDPRRKWQGVPRGRRGRPALKRLDDRKHRRRAVVLLRREGAKHDGDHMLRSGMRAELGGDIGAFARDDAREQLDGHEPPRILIGTPVGALAAPLLRRHVARRSDATALGGAHRRRAVGRRQPDLRERRFGVAVITLRDPEVEELQAAVGLDDQPVERRVERAIDARRTALAEQ